MAALNQPSQSQAQPAATSKAKAKLGSTLRGRLMIALVAAAVIPTAIADLIGSNLVEQRSRQTAIEELELASLQAAVLSEEYLVDATQLPQVVSELAIVRDALREANQKAQAEGLTALPIETVDQRFAAKKVIQEFPQLNAFLKTVADEGGFAEIFVTEKSGFNVALSHPTSDVVQSDEGWWQETQAAGEGLLLGSDFDASTRTINIELTEPVLDPSNGEFLGVIKAGLLFANLDERLEPLLRKQDVIANAQGDIKVEDLQLLNITGETAEPLVAFGTEAKLEATLGGDLVQRIAAYIARVERDTTITEAQATETLKQEFGVKPLLVSRVTLEGKQETLAVFEAGDRIYSLTAIPDLPWVTLTSTRRATIAAAADQLKQVFLFSGIALAAAAAIAAWLLSQRLSRPLAALTDVAQVVSEGNLDVRAEDAGTAEMRTLAQSFNNQVSKVQYLLQSQEWFNEVSLAKTREELVAPLNKIMADIRKQLGADRMVVYRFEPDMGGYIAGEDVLPGWTQALNTTVFDACIPEDLLEGYREGRVVPTENVFEAGFHPAHQELMRRLEIKSNLVVPIASSGDLLGLLVAHHCQDFHTWKQSEIDLLKQYGTRLGAAMAGLSSLERQEANAEEQRLQREALEESLTNLMEEIESAADGDLTVRANLLEGDIGVVADLFNAIIENLQDTAQQVKRASGEVSHSLGSNEGAIREVADKAIAEAAEVRKTLGSIETMNQSIRVVADNAGQAAVIANDAFATAREGNSAMEQTVQGVLGLRNTIGETSKKMKRLGESAQKISQVVSLIDEIALKTNLLAINASVEANRAGEMGQGFTAVAQQVGLLAEQSAAAAKEIARVVSDIQLETQEAIAAMEQGTAAVVDNTRLVETTKQRLADVLEKSQEIDNLMRSISDATTSQAETSQVVSTLMQQVTEASEARSQSSREVAEAIQSTAAVAQSLQDSVEQFKVESV